MAPNPIPLPCAFAFPPPSHQGATTTSPCWAPHFVTHERIIFSNLTPSKPHRDLSPATTMSDDTLSALTAPLHYTSILQPATPPQVVAFESQTIFAPICLNRFTFAESRKSNLCTCVCLFTFSSSAFAFLIKTNISFKLCIHHHSSVEKSMELKKIGLSKGPRFDSGRKPVNSNQCGSEPIDPQARVLKYCFQQQKPIKSLSPQRFYSYFYLNRVAWQYQKYSTILILCCAFCV